MKLLISRCWAKYEIELKFSSYKKLFLSSYATSKKKSVYSSSRQFYHEDNKTRSIALIENVKQLRYSPSAAMALGFTGLTPFVAVPTYMIYSGFYLPSFAFAQLAYGASILSFIGGVRWGLTLPEGSTQSPDWHNLSYSVIPSLIAWVGLLTSPVVGNMTVMGGLALTGYLDLAMWGYPNWYKGMRFCLTVIAILSLWTTLMCKFILKDRNGDPK